jgi:hypothetical protein
LTSGHINEQYNVIPVVTFINLRTQVKSLVAVSKCKLGPEQHVTAQFMSDDSQMSKHKYNYVEPVVKNSSSSVVENSSSVVENSSSLVESAH